MKIKWISNLALFTSLLWVILSTLCNPIISCSTTIKKKLQNDIKFIIAESYQQRESNEGKISLKFSDTNWNDRQPLSIAGSKSFSLQKK